MLQEQFQPLPVHLTQTLISSNFWASVDLYFALQIFYYICLIWMNLCPYGSMLKWDSQFCGACYTSLVRQSWPNGVPGSVTDSKHLKKQCCHISRKKLLLIRFYVKSILVNFNVNVFSIRCLCSNTVMHNVEISWFFYYSDFTWNQLLGF